MILLQLLRRQVQILSEEREEPWKIECDAATRCFETEHHVAFLNFLFDQIIQLDEKWRSLVYTGQLEYQPGFEELLGKVLPDWKRGASNWTATIDHLEVDGYSVSGANELRRHITEAEDMLTTDESFFKGDKLVALRDAAIDSHRAGQSDEMGRMDH